MANQQTKTYEVLESFAVRSGVQVVPGDEVELTDDQARAFLFYNRIRPKPAAPPEQDDEVEGAPDVEHRDPVSGDRDPRPRRRR